MHNRIKLYLASIEKMELKIDTKKKQLQYLNQISRENNIYINDIRENISTDLKNLVAAKWKLYKIIEEIENPIYQTILILRYFCGYSWENIAEQTHYSYRHVHRLHNVAIEELSRKSMAILL